MNKTLTLLANAMIGIPGGCLIFMGMLMFNALLGKLVTVSNWGMLLLLCVAAWIVGTLIRGVRPINGFGAAVASGIVAAIIILFLRLNSTPGSNVPLVFGPVGMLAAIACSSMGGWLLPRLRKQK